MATYYPSLTINSSTPGSNDVYRGNGLVLFVGRTGTTASAAVSALNNATTDKWVIPLNPGANTFWFMSTSVLPYMAYYIVRPDGYTGPSTQQLNTGTTAQVSVGGSWVPKYASLSYLYDFYYDRTMTTTSWLSDVTSFSSYEDQALCPASAISTYHLIYGTGTTAWNSTAMGKRYAACSNMGFNADWKNSFATYYTSQPSVYTGYTVTVNSSTVSMTVYDEVQGYGTHAIRLVQVYAVTTGGTETLILSKAGSTTLSFGLNTISLGRQTTTVNGVKRFKMAFQVEVFNGVEAVECGVVGHVSDVTQYEGLGAIELYTDDISGNVTITSSGPVDLTLWASY